MMMINNILFSSYLQMLNISALTDLQAVRLWTGTLWEIPASQVEVFSLFQIRNNLIHFSDDHSAKTPEALKLNLCI